MPELNDTLIPEKRFAVGYNEIHIVTYSGLDSLVLCFQIYHQHVHGNAILCNTVKIEDTNIYLHGYTVHL